MHYLWSKTKTYKPKFNKIFKIYQNIIEVNKIFYLKCNYKKWINVSIPKIIKKFKVIFIIY